MTIRKRIYLGFASVVLFIAMFSVAVVMAMDTMHDNIRLIEKRYLTLEQVHNIQLAVQRINGALVQLMAVGATDKPMETLQAAKQVSETVREQLDESISTGAGWVHYEKAMADFDAWLAAVEALFRLQQIADKETASAFFVNEVEPLEERLNRSLMEFTRYQETLVAASVRESAQSNEIARASVWSGFALLSLLCAFTAAGVVRSTLRSIRSISAVMESVHQLDSTHTLPRMQPQGNDETVTIVKAFNRMAESLEERARQEREYRSRLEEQNWIDANIAGVMEACQGAKSIGAFGERLLNYAAPAAGAVAAALYYADPLQPVRRYHRVASYAADPAKADWDVSFLPGEGLVGQCAVDGEWIERKVPPGYLRVVSGVGAGDAAYVLLIPVRYENDVTAVLELGSFEPFSPRVKRFLSELAQGSLGISLQSIASYMQVQKLLAESQTYVQELQLQSEELQQQQEELRSLNEKLAEQFRTSEQRSEELERIRLELIERTKELEKSSQFKSEFLANISHELRTPLNSLLILAQMLAEDPEGRLSEKQKEYAQTILMSGNSLLELINDVLDLAKIEAGQAERSDEAFSIMEFVFSLERQFSGLALEKSLDFSVEVAPELHHARFVTDVHMLRQILNNLLSNAFKFTEQGSVQLKVYAEQPPNAGAPGANAQDDAPGREETLVAFAVRDTGIGIPPDKHELIFETFRQADGRTNRKYGGTGLGLSISRELAAILGGTLRLVSEEGKGSTFTAVVPMKRIWDIAEGEMAAIGEAAAAYEVSAEEVEPVAAEDKPPDDADGSEEAGEGYRATILLVDDDIRNVYALSAALMNRGYSVVFAEDGQAALNLLNERPDIDLVLMDMMMPGIDGYEAMRSIRANPRFARLPIIALTAKAMKEDRELCLAAGANDYLSKPVKLDKLLSLLRVWLDGAENRSE